MWLSTMATLLGGVGLFLLGMRLMTQGLSLAAGRHLRHVLSRWTKTPFLGACSGILITALVQSSSAVTVAVIGFVNAGLMTLAQSVGVIFGSNIGTTITGWIVAAVGLSLNIKGLALPLVGLGVVLRLTAGTSRRAPLGDALAGFGLFFLGIGALQGGLHGLGGQFDIASYSDLGLGLGCTPIYLGIGIALTVLMQSSSAAMAVVLTAALSGVLGLECAAAAVIGTNLGTTSTAALSVIGATPNAKKVAASHIIFNLGTALIALLSLPLLLDLVDIARDLFGLSDDPASSLALFHTCFNVVGVALFLPLTNRLVRFLEKRIGKPAPNAQLQFLDDTVLKAPPVAMDALFMEIGRMGDQARLMAQKAIKTDFSYPELAQDKAWLDGLIYATREFCTKLQRADLPRFVAAGLPPALRVLQYYKAMADIVLELHHSHGATHASLPQHAAEAVQKFKTACKDILNLAENPCMPEFDNLELELAKLLDVYHELKQALLDTGAEGLLDLDSMVSGLELSSRTRRMVEQAVKGTMYWSRLRNVADTCRNINTDITPHWAGPD